MKVLAHLILFVFAMTSFKAVIAPGIAGEIVCEKNDRKFNSKDFTSGETVEIVKGYDCGPLRAEFVRLNEVAYALLENKDSKRIELTLGTPRLVRTSVVDAYSKFRSLHGTNYAELAVTEELPYQDTSASGYHKTFATIFEPEGSRAQIEYFPAMDEMQKLSRDEWPKGVKIFVSQQDLQQAVRELPTPTLWRSVTSQDISSLAENRQRFNATIPEPESFMTTVRSGQLDFLLAVSGGSLPDELIRLQGWHSEFEVGCALAPFPAALSAKRPRLFLFETQMPELYFDAILLRNTSKKAIDVNHFLGETQLGTGLRRIDKPGRTAATIGDLSDAVSIAPGESAILPTAMLLRPRELAPCCGYVPGDQKKAADALNEFRSAGYAVSNDDYQTPTFPIYFEVLPAHSLSGLNTSVGDMNFERTRPLRLSFNVSLEAGSCPYLMSKTGLNDDELWSDHGKILHSAQTPAFKGSHVEQMEGAPSTFRIEEREHETAIIDMARLTVTYVDGTKETFSPSLDVLKSNDGKEAMIGWGQAIQFSFPVKDTQDHRVPLTSDLEVVGYYERIDLNRLVNLNWRPPQSGSVRDGPGVIKDSFCPSVARTLPALVLSERRTKFLATSSRR